MISERELTEDVIALIQERVVRPVLFMYADFPSGEVFAWTGVGDIDWNSNSWIGIGGAVSFETIAETTDTSAKGLTVRVNGLDNSWANRLLNDAYQGRDAHLYFAFFNVTRSILYPIPGAFWSGFLDSDEATYGRKKADIVIKCEHELVDILRKREYRYTDRDQKLLYPDKVDTGLSRIEAIQDTKIPWGRTQE